MKDTGQEFDPSDSPEVMAGPMLLLLRRVERSEFLIKILEQRGILTKDDIGLANLRSTLSHAERLIRVRGRSQKPTADIEQAADEVRKEIHSLESQQSV